MTNKVLQAYRNELRAQLTRMDSAAASLEEQVRLSPGSIEGGNLSSVPMHLGDLGTETYTQELSATLLENEEYLRGEVIDALKRIDSGAFGRCERCGTDIMEERLEALPYTRYCTPCAAATEEGFPTNFNDGRPRGFDDSLSGQSGWVSSTEGDQQAPFTKRNADTDELEDRHAAGTAGGGTAVGGLAGMNIGHGDPDDKNLNEAHATGSYDQDIEEDDEETSAYSGPHGGAVGGTPAGKRASGGRNAK